MSLKGDMVGVCVGALVEGGLSVGLGVGESVDAAGGLVGVCIGALVKGGSITTTFWDPKLPLTFLMETPSNSTSK